MTNPKFKLLHPHTSDSRTLNFRFGLANLKGKYKRFVITLKNLFVKIAPKCALDNEGNPTPLTVAITWKYYLVIVLAIFVFLGIIWNSYLYGRNEGIQQVLTVLQKTETQSTVLY